VARFAIDVTACWRPRRVGMTTVAVELTKALVGGRGADEFTLLCSRERPPALEALDCEAVFSPYRHEVALKALWLPYVETQLGCDAILYPYWPSPPRRRAGAPPAAICVYDLAFKLRPGEVPWQQRAYMGSVLGPALRHAAAVLVISETTRDDLLNCYPIPGLEERLVLLPLGVTPLPPAGPLPAGLEPGFILAVGTVEPRKNYPRLLAAYRQLRSRQLQSQVDVPELVIAGRPGWAYGDTLEQIRAEPGVRYLDHVDGADLTALYESAAVLAFPSLYEGFGLPLLEAMAHGLPSVVSSVGALPEVANGAAILVDPEDVSSIARGLERLLEDPALRKKIADQGRRRAADFSWARAAEVTIEVLRRIGAPAGSSSSRTML
jgi:glycosyltransferase involved in cell wall biosynthesis